MALADELARESSSPIKGPRCGVWVALQEMDPNDATTLADALDRGHGFSALSRALARAGHPIAAQTLARHARQECNCRVAR